MTKKMKRTLLLVLVMLVFTIAGNAGVVLADEAQEGAYVGTIPEEGLTSSEGQVTLTVGGVETQIVPGAEYTEADDAYVTISNSAGDYASETATGAADYRAGLFVDEDGVNESKSVLEAIVGGSYDGESATGITIDSNSDNFNGIMLVDAGDYTISDSTFNFLSEADGSNTNDFIGYGAVISAFGNSKLIIDNVSVYTEGVVRTAVVADEGADILVTNSDMHADGGTLYEGYQNTADTTVMVAPPWVLGISGNARTTNLLGNYSTYSFVNSDISAKEWGVLSTDGCSNVVLTTIDSTVELTGDSGYGTYAIGNAKEYFYGSTFNVATYANIITGGYVTYASSNGTFTISKDDEAQTAVFEDIEGAGSISTVNSEAFGIMWHGDGEANILDGSVFNTKNAMFLIKNGTVEINVDNSELNVEDGIILQMIDNDDSVVGMDFETMAFNTEFNEEEGYPGIDNDLKYDPSTADSGMPGGDMPEGDMAEGEAGGEMPEGEMAEGEAGGEMPEGEGEMAEEEGDSYSVTANFTNVTIEGSMYNATGYVGSPKTLLVTLGSGAELSGAISAASAIHSTDGGETQNTHFTIDEYYKLGHVVNKEYYNGDNDVAVVVAEGGSWKVTGTSYLTSLTVEDGGTLKGTVEVDGSKVKVEAGEIYEGEIVVTPASQLSVIAIIIAAAVIIVAVLLVMILKKKSGSNKE